MCVFCFPKIRYILSQQLSHTSARNLSAVSRGGDLPCSQLYPKWCLASLYLKSTWILQLSAQPWPRNIHPSSRYRPGSWHWLACHLAVRPEVGRVKLKPGPMVNWKKPSLQWWFQGTVCYLIATISSGGERIREAGIPGPFGLVCPAPDQDYFQKRWALLRSCCVLSMWKLGAGRAGVSKPEGLQKQIPSLESDSIVWVGPGGVHFIKALRVILHKTKFGN